MAAADKVAEKPGGIQEFFRSADRWLFGFGSPVTLGLFRMVFCAIVLITLALGLPNFTEFYTEEGLFTADMAQRMRGDWIRFSIMEWSLAPAWGLAVYLFTMLLAFLGMIGLWTRPVMIALAVLVVSVQYRNLMILHSGDTLMRILLIFLALAPCGAAVSLDRVLDLWKGKRPPEPAAVSLWPQRLIQLQIALVYFTTVWHKWPGATWRDGTAVWYPLNLREFERFPLPAWAESGIIIPVGTYGTLLVELALATLVWYKPWRNYVLLAGVGMHLFIEYRLNIPMFSAIIVAAYICFYDGEEVSRGAKRFGNLLARFKAKLLGQWIPNKMTALKALDPFDLLTYETTSADAPNQSRLFSTRSVGYWPLIWVPGLSRKLLRSAQEPPTEVNAESTPR